MAFLLPDYSSVRTRCWLFAHAITWLMIVCNIVSFQLELKQGRIRHRHMFWAMMPTVILAGLLWGSVPFVVGSSTIPLYYIFFTVACIYPLCGYCWTFGFWLLGHMFSLSTLLTLTVLDVLFNEMGGAILPMYTSLYAILLAATTLLICWCVASSYLGQMQVENQNEVIQLLLREFEEGAQDWIWETNDNFDFVYVPSRMNEAFGSQKRLTQNCNVSDLFPQDGPSTHLLWSRLKNRKPFSNIEVCLNDDHAVWWSLSGKPLFDEMNRFVGFRGIGSDISDARKVSESETSKRRHDAIVQMAGSIAHDFNNVLSTILTCVELVRMTTENSEDVASYVDLALDGCNRGRSITSQLVSFAGQDFALDPHVFDARLEIQSIIDAVVATAPGDIRIQLHDGKNLNLYVDRVQFGRAIRNLLENSVNAIVGQRDASLTPLNEIGRIGIDCRDGMDGLAQIVVNDNGPGIPKESFPKIFDPFFTTRRHRGGSGLGLSMVHGFAVQCGGQLTAANNSDGGACFLLELPLASCDAENVPAPTIREIHAPDMHVNLARRTIFLLEDDGNLANSIKMLMESRRIGVIHVDSVAEARREFDLQSDTIDCILSDVMLPDGRGFDFVRCARERCPTIPVVYLSGYSDALQSEISSAPKGAFLAKPFRPQELISLVSHEIRRVSYEAPERQDQDVDLMA